MKSIKCLIVATTAEIDKLLPWGQIRPNVLPIYYRIRPNYLEKWRIWNYHFADPLKFKPQEYEPVFFCYFSNTEDLEVCRFLHSSSLLLSLQLSQHTFLRATVIDRVIAMKFRLISLIFQSVIYEHGLPILSTLANSTEPHSSFKGRTTVPELKW